MVLSTVAILYTHKFGGRDRETEIDRAGVHMQALKQRGSKYTTGILASQCQTCQ